MSEAPPPRHILGEAGLADFDAKLEKLSMDSRRSPQRVGDAHLADQPANFQPNSWSAAAVPASLFPLSWIYPDAIRLEAENAVLRHQLIVLGRRLHGRVRLTNDDRWFFTQLYRWFPAILRVLTIIRPETLVRWHRAGVLDYPARDVLWRSAAHYAPALL